MTETTKQRSERLQNVRLLLFGWDAWVANERPQSAYPFLMAATNLANHHPRVAYAQSGAAVVRS